MFIQVKTLRIRTSIINTYELLVSEFSGVKKYKIKIVTSRSAHSIQMDSLEEANEILKLIDEILQS